MSALRKPVVFTARPPGIHFRDLTLAYDRHPAIHHLDASLPSGSLTAIVGPNGSGKSSLLKAMIGELRPAEGSIHLSGFTRQDIAYLPQQIQIDRRFPLNVLDFLSSGLWRECGSLRAPSHADRGRLLKALHQVGLQDFEHRLIGSLSGGQLQRLMFARLIVQQRPVLLLDEPFNAVDDRTARDLLALIREWHGEARTILVVTHDLEQVKAHFPNTLLLARELLGHGDTAEVLTASNLLRARRMCEAFDEQARLCRRSERS